MVRGSGSRAAAAVLSATVLLSASCSTAGGPVPGLSAAPVPGPSAGPAGDWLGYHADRARTGAVTAGPTAGRVRTAWTADLGGAVRGQAVVVGARVIAATENNRVAALAASTGRVLWSVSLGRPLRNVRSAAGCGNIDPLGVTSTPVVDPASGTVYVVGEVADGHGSVHHQLTGLDVATGAVRVSRDVDPPLPAGERPVTLLQRASLALGNGRVYVSYGGNAGDCGRYHGWVVGVRTQGPADPVSFEVAPDGEGGAIWMSGGAPALDPAGNLYVTTGNANPDPPQGGPDPLRYTESVVKLDPDLHPLAAFKDRIAGGDEDLSTGNPVLTGDTVFAVGKTDVAYLLRASDLTQQAAIRGVCGSDPDGGPAWDAVHRRMFVPCRDGGIQVVDVGNRTLGPRLAGADSSPVLVGGTVWALDHRAGILTGFDAASGRIRQRVELGADVPVFVSPSAGAGLLLVGTTTGVVALR